MKNVIAVVAALGSFSAAALEVQMNKVTADGIAAPIGTIEVSQSQYGLVFTPHLSGLEPGIHGFHVHQFASCEPKMKNGKMVAAAAAGGHYDPLGSNKQSTPWGDGHLGDLPALYVDQSGNADYPVLAPRLQLSDLKGRSLMIHAGGDNYSDQPAPLGGGGARVACGVSKG